jgi:anti-sigma regulatory factor (Ser/Thr protein kinase)
MKKCKLEFSSHTANLALMRNAVRNFLVGYDFTEKERTLIVLGVDEACTNIIRYAYDLADDQLILLEIDRVPNGVRVRLRDYGKGITQAALKTERATRTKPGGFGLFLMRNAFDQVHYIRRKRGTELVLTKYFD